MAPEELLLEAEYCQDKLLKLTVPPPAQVGERVRLLGNNGPHGRIVEVVDGQPVATFGREKVRTSLLKALNWCKVRGDLVYAGEMLGNGLFITPELLDELGKAAFGKQVLVSFGNRAVGVVSRAIVVEKMLSLEAYVETKLLDLGQLWLASAFSFPAAGKSLNPHSVHIGVISQHRNPERIRPIERIEWLK
jgi:hypothetical protein